MLDESSMYAGGDHNGRFHVTASFQCSDIPHHRVVNSDECG
jgi:hypothetical protein